MGSRQLAIACVLKVGQWHNGHILSEYQPKHVQWMARMVAAHVTVPHRFVCLSDVLVPGVETIPLEEGWPGWWSKMELFRHDFGRVFYLDLDTVIVGNIDELLEHPHQFTALHSFAHDLQHTLGSGLMAWDGPRMDLFDEFKARTGYHMDHCKRRNCWGDQGFIGGHVGKWEAWQRLFPGQVISYKADLKHGRRPPAPGAKVVCFHGKPKPWEVAHSWITK